MRVRALGARAVPSPLASSFVDDDVAILRDAERGRTATPEPGPELFEKAGPRARLFFDPKRTTAAVLSAGGLCPGINDVVRAIVLELRHAYGVERILGVRHGFAGLDPNAERESIALTDDVVRDIHMHGGTVLGTSRGPHEPAVVVSTLAGLGVDVLFVIGGDGSMHAAHGIHEEAARRGLPIAVVGIPKTIDDDIPYVDKTFGFETAVATARLVIDAAHAEARSVRNGVGVVELMGRSAGFLAVHASLASQDVNACLVPEVPFDVARFCGWLDERLARRGHAVVVVAEGCARALERRDGPLPADASGNVRFAALEVPAGHALGHAIESYFAERGAAVSLKHINPSYLVRATRATGEDAVYCAALARNAVHAAMAGKTDVMVGRWHRCFTHVALEDVLAADKRVDPRGELWRELVESTGQPSFTVSPGETREDPR